MTKTRRQTSFFVVVAAAATVLSNVAAANVVTLDGDYQVIQRDADNSGDLTDEDGMAPSSFDPVAIGAFGTDIVVADFEGNSYGSWTADGDAFGPVPATGTLPGQHTVDGFKGRGLVNTFRNGDRSTGTLTSPEFTIERPFITFLIGGGKDAETTAMHLVVDGKVVRRATGPNEHNSPNGSETLAPGFWDVSEFVGRKAVIRIVDNATGGWGHLNVDQIVQTDRKPIELSRDFVMAKKYLAIPIKNGAPKRVVTTLVDGRPVFSNAIELADAEPDWWAVMDVEPWKGRTVTLQVNELPIGSSALTSVEQTDEFKGKDPLYQEPLRNQFHFSPRRGFHNDPNGLVFYRGEYHLFFQHNPYGMDFGNQHWGHAVSRDLVHWEELAPALRPDDSGLMYSGSAVVDWNNTSGFGQDGEPPLIMLYTSAAKGTEDQRLAYSTDGRTFTKYEGNPVLKQITPGNRDPKVFWHEPTKRWVMALYVARPTIEGVAKTPPEMRHTIEFFTSPNLRDWTRASVHEVAQRPPGPDFYLYECPDFFELPVDGDPNKKKWVLISGNTDYAIGTFDGVMFSAGAERLVGPARMGRSGPFTIYSTQTFNDLPDGRRISIIWWVNSKTEGMPFARSMTLPLELKLISTADGPRMTFTPVKELEALRAKSHVFGASELEPGAPNPLAGVKSELVELRAEFEPGDAKEIVFQVRGTAITYDAAEQELVVNGEHAPAPLRDGKQRIAIFCDRTGLEIFASDGLAYMALPVRPKPADLSLAVEAKDGRAKFDSFEVHELKSAWQQPEVSITPHSP